MRPYDKAKHKIYKALKEELPTAHSWDDLKDALADRNSDIKFKVSREFSYLNIDNRLEQNACASSFEYPKQGFTHKDEEVQQIVSHSDNGSSIGFGLLNGSSSYDATAAEEAEFNRLMKKKKAKRKRGFRL